MQGVALIFVLKAGEPYQKLLRQKNHEGRASALKL